MSELAEDEVVLAASLPAGRPARKWIVRSTVGTGFESQSVE